MNCIKFISKLFAPKESQIPYYQVLSMDPRKTTTQQRKKARLEMKQQHFNTYNNKRARRCIEPITYDEYNKMLKLEELHYEKDKERSENYHMSCFDKKKNNNQKELLLKKIYSPTDEFAEMNRMNRKQRMALEAQNNYKVNMRNFQTHLESEQGQRDLERLTIVKKRREEDRIKRELEGRAPGWTPNGIEDSSDENDEYSIEDTNNSILDVASENIELPSQTKIIYNDLIDNRLKLIYSSDNYVDIINSQREKEKLNLLSRKDIIKNETQVNLIMENIKKKREIKNVPEIKRFSNN